MANAGIIANDDAPGALWHKGKLQVAMLHTTRTSSRLTKRNGKGCDETVTPLTVSPSLIARCIREQQENRLPKAGRIVRNSLERSRSAKVCAMKRQVMAKRRRLNWADLGPAFIRPGYRVIGLAGDALRNSCRMNAKGRMNKANRHYETSYTVAFSSADTPRNRADWSQTGAGCDLTGLLFDSDGVCEGVASRRMGRRTLLLCYLAC